VFRTEELGFYSYLVVEPSSQIKPLACSSSPCTHRAIYAIETPVALCAYDIEEYSAIFLCCKSYCITGIGVSKCFLSFEACFNF